MQDTFARARTRPKRARATIGYLVYEAYANEIKLKIENNFLIKSESKSTSKRTILCNPWITPGVIASVNKEHFLYAQWRKSVTKVNKLGSLEL